MIAINVTTLDGSVTLIWNSRFEEIGLARERG